MLPKSSTVGYLEYQYRELLTASGRLKVKLLNGNHQLLTLSFPKIESVKNRENYFLAIINSIRQKIIADFQAVFPKDPAAQALDFLKSHNVKYYHTNQSGTMEVISDEKNSSVN